MFYKFDSYNFFLFSLLSIGPVEIIFTKIFKEPRIQAVSLMEISIFFLYE